MTDEELARANKISQESDDYQEITSDNDSDTEERMKTTMKRVETQETTNASTRIMAMKRIKVTHKKRTKITMNRIEMKELIKAPLKKVLIVKNIDSV